MSFHNAMRELGSLELPTRTHPSNPTAPPRMATANDALATPASIADELNLLAKMVGRLVTSPEVQRFDSGRQERRDDARRKAPTLGEHLQPQPSSASHSVLVDAHHITTPPTSLFGAGGEALPLISLSTRLGAIHSKLIALHGACEQLRVATSAMAFHLPATTTTCRSPNNMDLSLLSQSNPPLNIPQPPPNRQLTASSAATPSPRLHLTKPSSQRVKQLPRATVPAGLATDAAQLKKKGADAAAGFSNVFNPNFKELQKVMTSTLYNVVESVVRMCQADKGYITTRHVSKTTMSAADAAALLASSKHGGNAASPRSHGLGGSAEMVAIVNVEAALRFPPSLRRHPVEGSLAAGVLATGIALHQRAVPYPPGDPAEDLHKDLPSSRVPITSNVLMFPIRRPPAVGDGWGASPSSPIAVLVVEDKHGGTTPFTAVDENLCNMATLLIGDIMTRMPETVLDWSANYYDPIGLHVVEPFVPFSKALAGRFNKNSPLASGNASNDSTFLTAVGAQRGDTVLEAMTRMAPHVPEQLIRRATVQPSSSKARRDVSGQASSLIVPSASGGDVSTYFTQMKEQKALLDTVAVTNTAALTSVSRRAKDADTTLPLSKTQLQELTFSSSASGGAIAGLGPAPTLREVDSFLTNLTDCWQRSVQGTLEQQLGRKQQEREAKLLREQLNGANKHIQKLEAELRLHKLSADDYKEEYRSLHQELESFLKTRTAAHDT